MEDISYDGNRASYEDGRQVFVGNNGNHYVCQLINANGDETTFMLTPEAATFIAIQILAQSENIKQ